MQKNIRQIEQSKCTGCSACFSVCPYNAIAMAQDAEGFWSPQVEQSLCVNCGLCLKVCPAEQENSKKEAYTVETYAAQNATADVLNKSSSGGVFFELANAVIEKGGVVYGCALNNQQEATHVRVDTVQGLFQILGSKYVQSKVDCFKQVKEDLKKGLYILFSGTPCQIAGLKSFLKQPYENLLCVDFICHGVPAPAVLKKYLQAQEKLYGKTITHVEFRSKKLGWENFAMRCMHGEDELFCEGRNQNQYLKAFLANLSIRKSCGQCTFNTLPRQSDITLGDYWETNWAENIKERGVSVAVVNTAKGSAVFQSVQSHFTVQAITVADIKRGNPFLDGHCKLHKRRSRFFKFLNQLDIEENIQQCLRYSRWDTLVEIAKYQFEKRLKK